MSGTTFSIFFFSQAKIAKGLNMGVMIYGCFSVCHCLYTFMNQFEKNYFPRVIIEVNAFSNTLLIYQYDCGLCPLIPQGPCADFWLSIKKVFRGNKRIIYCHSISSVVQLFQTYKDFLSIPGLLVLHYLLGVYSDSCHTFSDDDCHPSICQKISLLSPFSYFVVSPSIRLSSNDDFGISVKSDLGFSFSITTNKDIVFFPTTSKSGNGQNFILITAQRQMCFSLHTSNQKLIEL